MPDLLKKAEQEAAYYFNRFFNGHIKTILFYPEYPHKRTIIYKILKHLKYNITCNPKHKFDLGFYWEDATFRKKVSVLEKFEPCKIMNLNCTDISKEKISKAFEEVFGYGFNVDPTSFVGNCVKKNNLNAKHDGVVVDCPVQEVEEGFVYQKILNNKMNDNFVMDIRTPVLKGKIPFVYLKFKKTDVRFTNDLYKSEMASCHEYLTIEEMKKISEFCLKIGLDYGELDILRNRDDDYIYIVDVNYTPWGPPAKLKEDESRMAVLRMSEEFRKLYFS